MEQAVKVLCDAGKLPTDLKGFLSLTAAVLSAYTGRINWPKDVAMMTLAHIAADKSQEEMGDNDA